MSSSVPRWLRTEAVGVVVPVHDEEDLLGASLEAINEACAPIARAGVVCRTVIVLDHCVDASGKISRDWVKKLRRQGGSHQAMVHRLAGTGVGAARRSGSSALLAGLSGTEPRRIWVATTDADSRVPHNWLTVQVAAHECGADIWSGRVAVEDWSHHRPDTADRWSQAYDRENTPIHGANLGFNGQAYMDSGGFPVVQSGEDRALHQAIVAQGGRAVEDHDTRVITSGRAVGRAPLGFSYALSSLDRDIRSCAPPALTPVD